LYWELGVGISVFVFVFVLLLDVLVLRMLKVQVQVLELVSVWQPLQVYLIPYLYPPSHPSFTRSVRKTHKFFVTTLYFPRAKIVFFQTCPVLSHFPVAFLAISRHFPDQAISVSSSLLPFTQQQIKRFSAMASLGNISPHSHYNGNPTNLNKPDKHSIPPPARPHNNTFHSHKNINTPSRPHNRIHK